MKKLVVLFSTGLVFTSVSAQTVTRNWSVAGGFGAAFPIGEFGSKNVHDNRSVYAKTGISVSVSVARKIAPAFDAMALFTGQQHSVNNYAMSQDMTRAANDTIAYAYKSRKWQLGTILAGGAFRFPLTASKKVYFTTRLMAGAMKTTLPQISIASVKASSTGGWSAAYTEHSNTALHWAFACLAGAGLKGFLVKNIFFQVNLDYLQSWPEFPSYYKDFRGPGGSYTLWSNQPPQVFASAPAYRQPLGSISLTGGIGISF